MSLLSYHSRRLCAKTNLNLTRYLTQLEAARDGKTRIPSLEASKESFEAAGVRPVVAASLRVAFPNVQKPTAMQRKLIRAMTQNRDILLQDDTGTGKSFAAVLALLSKISVRHASSVTREDNDGIRRAPSCLLLVPHRDLAYQYLHWMHHMTLHNEDTPSSLATYAQVLVRHANKSTLRSIPARMQEAIRCPSSEQDPLAHKPPQILIATPSTVLEVIERQTGWFQLATLSTVVVDEVDALLRIPTGKLPKGHGRASGQKVERHVPDLVRILDRLFLPSRNKKSTDGQLRCGTDETLEHPDVAPVDRPQLVMISATLRSRLQSALFNTFGWVRRGGVLKLVRKRSSALPCHRLGRSAIHHVLVVSKTGDIKNIIGALPSQPSVLLARDEGNEEEGAFYDDDDDPKLMDETDKELVHAPLGVDPGVLEAVAAVFALDVPRVALLVLPATAGVRKIIFELRQLGVNAHPLDLVDDGASRTHILSGKDEGSEENPVLIVATLGTVRGIDLPELSHVFMLGVPEGRSGDAYLHVAGRVGRFGRQGKVITVVEEQKEERVGDKVVVTDCGRKMALLLSRIGVQARRLEHFG